MSLGIVIPLNCNFCNRVFNPCSWQHGRKFCSMECYHKYIKNKHNQKLTLPILKEYLVYNPSTGIFIWNLNKSYNAKAGDQAGYIDCNGYVKITLNGKTYSGHSLAWFYMTGEELDELLIDHKDKNRKNNRWDNLRRCVDFNLNLYNKSFYKSNTSGYRGVHFHKGSWVASISKNNKKQHIGCFKIKENAALAYNQKAKEFFGDFAVLNEVLQ